MPRELIYAPRAQRDLEAITRWLTQPGSGPRARRRLAAIWAAIERLREHPCRYQSASIGAYASFPVIAATERYIASVQTLAVTTLPVKCE